MTAGQAGEREQSRSVAATRLLRARRGAGGDGATWVVALTLAVLLRSVVPFDPLALIHAHDVAIAVGVAVAGQLAIGSFLGLYVGRWTNGSFDELPALVWCVASVTTVLVVGGPSRRHPGFDPISVAIVSGFLAFVFMGSIRWLWRDLADRRQRPKSAGRTPVLVFGAGDGGQQASEPCCATRTARTCRSRCSTTTPRSRTLGSGVSAWSVIATRSQPPPSVSARPRF